MHYVSYILLFTLKFECIQKLGVYVMRLPYVCNYRACDESSLKVVESNEAFNIKFQTPRYLGRIQIVLHEQLNEAYGEALEV